jgi:hypothetical protein
MVKTQAVDEVFRIGGSYLVFSADVDGNRAAETLAMLGNAFDK